MTADSARTAVTAFGFTPRQAGFLVLVLRHAGVCLRRQYPAYAGIVYGKKTQDFFADLVARRFATPHPLGRVARVYHLHHKGLYRAIGEPEARFRKATTLGHAVERLMVLDALLLDPHECAHVRAHGPVGGSGMLRAWLEVRSLVAATVAAGVGVWGVRTYPLDADNVFLALIALRRPGLFAAVSYGHVALWIGSAFVATSLATSLVAIVVYRRTPTVPSRPLPPYPPPEDRPTPSLVLGETHFLTTPGRAPAPSWLAIPQRGLYTGVLVLGAVGTGKTSACLYPYVAQLLRWRADDPERRLGGLVLEVKGDFCRQVHDMLRAAGRGDDYLEIGLEGDVCYNPLHNDLDPYALAYAIAALINNLFGKSKEPFWQQAYTDLLKFVILLRRLTDGYTTLAEVYRYVLDSSQIERDITRLKPRLAEPPEVIVISQADHEARVAREPWTLWFVDTPGEQAHPYEGALEVWLDAQAIPFRVQRATGGGWAARRHQLDAVERWYHHGWSRLDARLRSSITEGVVVFLSLFDDNPAVHRAFCPPRSAYTDPPAPGAPRPLPPLEELLETGRVLALNFPVALNPGLARAIGVMLKLDFQRAVLQRIPRIAAAPERVWRDLLFVCAVPDDGSNPLPPQYCYLKPHYLDVQTSYFDQLAQGAL